LGTLRDKPDISPWSLSGKLDWTTLTEEVSMGSDSAAEQQQPRDPSPDAGLRPAQDQQQDHADGGNQEAGDDQPSLRVPSGEPAWARTTEAASPAADDARSGRR
jgi:hypothetical protein